MTNPLTTSGTITALATGLTVWMGAGYTGLAMLGSFFVMGVGATSWQINKKQQMGLAERNSGRRNAGQVMANGGTAAILGLLGWIMPQQGELLLLMMAAAMSSATADTLSSELGNLYGRNFYNILTFKKDRRGENGVVSLEGTACGLTGSAIIAVVYVTGAGWFPWHAVIIITAGTAGNIFDSVLGASAERTGAMG